MNPRLLVLVRHAESERNVAKKGNVFFTDDEARRALRATADHRVPITALGRRQAEATGRGLHDRFGAFDAIVHSGYARTIQTADEILRVFPGAPSPTHDLFVRERDTGHGWDMTTAEAEVAFPWLEEYWKTIGPFFARPPGGESVAQVCERVQMFLHRIERAHAGQRVLVVTHGVTMRAFRYLIEGWSYDQIEVNLRAPAAPNASYTAYESEANGPLRLVAADVAPEVPA
jgi:probable phosphoglycerate mutase